MRRKRRTRYTWFPIIGSDGPGETGDDFNTLHAELTIAPDGSTTVAINPLIPDVPLEGNAIPTGSPGQLVGALGQEYVIERIVGNCFLSVSGPADDAPAAVFPKTFLIGVGIFVARANDDTSGGGAGQPIGSATAAERNGNYSPLSPDPIREPWMYRNTWLLATGRQDSNPNAQWVHFNGDGQQAGISLHTTNTYSSGKAGPHFDVKSVRRIHTDERLWLVLAARTLDNEFVPGVQPNTVLPEGVAMVFDYRVLGALRRAHNRSNF